MKIGIYPGSFNPFHVGHKNIYEKSLKIFDMVFILRGINPDKPKSEIVIPLLPRVVEYSGVLTDFIKDTVKTFETKEVFVIRGFRNVDDIKYNSEQDYWLKQVDPSFQSIYIECDEEFKHISSSVIKTLKQLNQPYKHLIA